MPLLLPTLIVFFDLALPAALLVWLWKSKARSRLYLLSIVLLAALYLVAVKVSILGFWHVIGAFWPPLFLTALVAIISIRVRGRVPGAWLPVRGSKQFLITGFNVLLASICALLIARVGAARFVELHTLKLSPPLRNGTFLIISGGANYSVNYHSRAARYALDISRLGSFWIRARSAEMFPKDLTTYAIYRAEVIAPCTGEIIAVEDRKPNREPLHPDESGFGNYVAVYCQGHTVRLVHLEPESVRVAVGQAVMVGQLLGNVGNSGNTGEPHLHIDAVAGRLVLDSRDDHGVQSVPIEIDNRFLIKGDTFKN